MGRRLIPVLTVGALLVGTPAFAQESAPNKAAAEALYQQGQDLMTQAKYEEACDKFRSSQQLDARDSAPCYTWRTATKNWAARRVRGRRSKRRRRLPPAVVKVRVMKSPVVVPRRSNRY